MFKTLTDFRRAGRNQRLPLCENESVGQIKPCLESEVNRIVSSPFAPIGRLVIIPKYEINSLENKDASGFQDSRRKRNHVVIGIEHGVQSLESINPRILIVNIYRQIDDHRIKTTLGNTVRLFERLRLVPLRPLRPIQILVISEFRHSKTAGIKTAAAKSQIAVKGPFAGQIEIKDRAENSSIRIGYRKVFITHSLSLPSCILQPA